MAFNKSNLNEKIDELKPKFIERLRSAVEIPSVSGDESLRPQVVKTAEFLQKELIALGAQDIELRELGTQPPPVANKDLQLPPIVLSRFGKDPSKKTVLVYGHYDVQPAALEDGWNSDPFKLVEKNGVLYGRGSSDDKGPVIGWLNAIQAHKELGLELPVNLITVFEGMEESGSLGLDELIKKEANGYFKGVDAVTISDNYWLGTEKPVLTYGLRGVNYYEIEVSGPNADLHSGLFGGIVSEPLNDLVKLLANLVDGQGKILIKGIDEQVAPLTEKEDKIYDDIEFDVKVLNDATGSETALYNDKKSILQHRWRYPSLSIHGIEGAFAEAGAKTVIPAKVKGKFSIRTVPNIESNKLTELVIKHVEEHFATLKSPNQLKVGLIHDGDYWLSDPFNENFTAARKATKAVWGIEPDLTREGGSIPITLTFEKELKTSVLLLPIGRGDDGAHSTNEKLDLSNYIEGVKTQSAYLHYYAQGEK
ncbi:cytosolic nonspecific dipeptidase [Wickerhamomyces ciferrii]|uniref:Cytosolic nonspecific dipeptidase n=1 Tax=Wickerhamomyces ciferrii (strain ATCC 14091 / BCRC 22168 / CBS 111 / JCM 3599 / NBRC 0793 / NRRL Y-1031 F-60-10) TaxID=1206466 RepID=K0KRW9_WICCF|nr:cytosolic nonspecific dipeptidase [Wickerhamomyces ciferrii]CCH45886.1 cytosolic nonspecific dipeptidase [Wickerhamomyces ciferrii]